MKILKAIAFATISTASLLLFVLPIQSQQAPTNNTKSPVAPKVPPSISTNWKDFPNIEAGFMQGCIGKQALLPNQKKIKQEFCQCAFTAYKTRYTPQTFMQINTLVVKIGQDGTSLLGLMMQPEVNMCFSQTGYLP